MPLHHTLARPAGRRADSRRDRPVRPALRARLRDPAGRRRRRAERLERRSPWPTSAPLLRQHLGRRTTRCGRTPTRLRTPGLGEPVAARLPLRLDRRGAPGARGPRYLVVDYKTNWLGPADEPLTAAAYSRERLVEAMLHSDYPLQALLYVVVVHRYLRWRQPGYDPAQHLGGRALPLRPRHVRPRHPGGRRPPVPASSRWQPPVALVDRAVRPPGRCHVTLLTLELEDPHDPRLAAGADGLLRVVQRGRACSTPPTCTSRSGSARWPARTTTAGRAGGGVRRCARSAAARSASTWPRSPTSRAPTLPWPEPDGVVRRGARQPAGHRRRRPVLRLLEHDGLRLLYLDRYWREEEQVHADLVGRPAGTAAARRRLAEPRRSTGSSRPRGTTSSGPPPGSRSPTARPCSPAVPAPARPRPSPRCSRSAPSRPSWPATQPLRIALAAPTGKAAARLQQAVEEEVARLPEADRDRLAGVRAVTLHRLLGCPARHLVPVPPPPRQPAAARRGRGRRDLDGLADDDGAGCSRRCGPAAG